MISLKRVLNLVSTKFQEKCLKTTIFKELESVIVAWIIDQFCFQRCQKKRYELKYDIHKDFTEDNRFGLHYGP